MRIIISIGIFLLVCVVVAFFIPLGPPANEMARYQTIGKFEAIDQSGAAFTSESLKGKVWLANFIFTSCAAECPVLTAKMKVVREKLKGRDDVAFVSLSVDPMTDTPERLTKYAAPYGEDDRWALLTGDVQEMDTLVKKKFLQPLTRARADIEELQSEGFIHSNKLIVFDQRGTARYHHDGLETDAVDRILEAMRRLLSEG